MSKYEPLRTHLLGHAHEAVAMSFEEIEGVLGFKLPRSKAYPAWWSNNPTNNVMTHAWLAAGYKTEQVDVERGKLVFRRSRAANDVVNSATNSETGPKLPRRHPLFGWMKGTVTVPSGTDLTEPADPGWADLAWGSQTGSNSREELKA